MKPTERTKDIIYISILFLLTLLFFEEMVFRGKILLLRDTFCDFLPWRIFARDSIKSGTIPLWNPYSRLGQPFLAFPQTAVFYPLNFLFYVLPVLFAYRLFIILHIFLAGTFMYLLMRHWRVLRMAAFVSAIVFMFNGVVISRLEFLSFISTFIWIPLLIYLIDKSINKFSLFHCLLTGVVLSVQFLAGHTQTFYYSYILLCFYWFFRFICKIFPEKKLSLKLLSILPIATATAFAIGMVQFLPTVELFNLSVRHGRFDHQMTEASLSPLHLITFFIPFYFGHPWDFSGIGLSEFWMGSFYIGILSCMLIIFVMALLCIGYKKKNTVSPAEDRNDLCRLTIFFLILTISSVILSMGIHTPVYKLFYNYFPLFNRFRWPSRIMEVAVFSLSILAGIGSHYLSLKFKSNAFVKILLPLIIIADLFLVMKGINYYSSPEIYTKKSDTVEYLTKDKDLFRVGTMYNDLQRDLCSVKDDSSFWKAKLALAGETSLPFHLSRIQGGGVLKIKYYTEFMEFLEFLDKQDHSIKKKREILRLLNLKYSLEPANMDNLPQNNINIKKNINFFPRFFIAEQVHIMNNKEGIFSTLVDNSFDLFKEIILEGDEDHLKHLVSKNEEINYEISNINYTANKISLSAKLDQNGFLVLSDTYYPGWKAYVDGQETTIYKTDYIIRSVFLEKGSHLIEFIYDPLSFKIGCIVTLSTVFILIIFAGFCYYGYYSKRWQFRGYHT